MARALKPLLVAFPTPAEDAAARIALYCRALQEEPIIAITEAVEEHIRTSKFFPRVCELLEGCERSKIKLRRRWAALRKALQPEKDEPVRVTVKFQPPPVASVAEKSRRLGGFTPPKPKETPQQMADRIRRHAEGL